MEKLYWTDYGADPTGAGDSTAAINECFAHAIALGKEAFGPAGRYKITNRLEWNDPMPRIRGMGHQTAIEADGTDYDWLTVGNGIEILGPTGWVHDIQLRRPLNPAPPRSPAGTTAGLRLNGSKFVDVRNVWVRFAPIGFAPAHNCYGTAFYNCRTLFDECNIGLYLPGAVGADEGAGNDMAFYNCWFHGGETAIWIEGSQGFYHFHGGQLLGGVGKTFSDDRGSCVTSGKSLDTGLPMGTCGLSFVGTTFERGIKGWVIRHFGAGTSPSGLSLCCIMCSFFGGRPGQNDETAGVLKLTGGYNDIIKFDCCVANGDFTEAVPISIAQAGGASRPYYGEFGTRGVPRFTQNGTLVGIDLNDRPMFNRSSINRAFTQSAITELHNGIVLLPDNTTGDILVSTDYGETFPSKLSIVPA